MDVTAGRRDASGSGLLLGVDCGQTMSKAALFDLDGHAVAVAGRRTEPSTPAPRRVERDMSAMWEQVASAVREVLTQVGGDARVLGVGVCGHNDGLYAVDAHGAPVRPAILATDSRAHAYAARTREGELGRRALELTGQVPFAASPASLYAWLRDTEPEAFGSVRWALFAKDWVRLRLTGQVATDPSDASASFTEVHSQDWSRAALDLYGLGDLAAALPPIMGSAEVAGLVTAEAAAATGLAEDTPVVTGAHDVDAASLGIGAATTGALSIVLGTFSINQVLADRPVADPRWQARSFVRPGRWLHMSTSPAGVANLDWTVRQLGPWTSAGAPDPRAAVAQAMSRLHSDDRPLFLPFLYGSPHGADLAASWVGVRGWHDRGDLLHAVLEGVAFNHRTHVDALREAFALCGPARVCGGGARSAPWTQLLADTLDLPVEVTDAEEAGARGAALLAGVGIGAYEGLESAVDRTVRVARRQAPDQAAVAMLGGRFRRYQRLVEALGPATVADPP